MSSLVEVIGVFYGEKLFCILNRETEKITHSVNLLGQEIAQDFDFGCREKYCLGISLRDWNSIDYVMQAWPVKLSSHEPWRKNILQLSTPCDIPDDLRYAMRNYHLFDIYDKVSEIECWVSDRVDHEVKEYRKFWSIT